VRNSQYVCAGDLRALDLLQHVLDAIKKGGVSADATSLAELVAKDKGRYNGIFASSLTLTRGTATVPLPGVDVPFHSSFLRPRMEAFRRVLLSNLEAGRIRPERLVGKYIPNVMGRPFEIGKDYVQDVLRVTESERIRAVVEDWDEWMDRVEEERRARTEVPAV
jgi:fatty acid synthase subunit beta, fungi type